jgi:hypothetical protein
MTEICDPKTQVHWILSRNDAYTNGEHKSYRALDPMLDFLWIPSDLPDPN